jgi:hypothetical protein
MEPLTIIEEIAYLLRILTVAIIGGWLGTECIDRVVSRREEEKDNHDDQP